MIADINKIEIEKQAREILDKFAKALEKIEKEHDIESWVDREEFERKERASSLDLSKENSKNPSCMTDNDFRQRMLSNAPQHDDDFIIAEKSAWKR